jgi:hypothetical protein
MNRIVVDQSAANQLTNSVTSLDQFEVVDPSGNTVGYFLPARHNGTTAAEIYAWAKDQISDEELDRRSKEPLGRTTAEVLARLNSL